MQILFSIYLVLKFFVLISQKNVTNKRLDIVLGFLIIFFAHHFEKNVEQKKKPDKQEIRYRVRVFFCLLV